MSKYTKEEIIEINKIFLLQWQEEILSSSDFFQGVLRNSFEKYITLSDGAYFSFCFSVKDNYVDIQILCDDYTLKKDQIWLSVDLTLMSTEGYSKKHLKLFFPFETFNNNQKNIKKSIEEWMKTEIFVCKELLARLKYEQ
jgi:hypothetical protein